MFLRGNACLNFKLCPLIFGKRMKLNYANKLNYQKNEKPRNGRGLLHSHNYSIDLKTDKLKIQL